MLVAVQCTLKLQKFPGVWSTAGPEWTVHFRRPIPIQSSEDSLFLCNSEEPHWVGHLTCHQSLGIIGSSEYNQELPDWRDCRIVRSSAVLPCSLMLSCLKHMMRSFWGVKRLKNIYISMVRGTRRWNHFSLGLDGFLGWPICWGDLWMIGPWALEVVAWLWWPSGGSRKSIRSQGGLVYLEWPFHT